MRDTRPKLSTALDDESYDDGSPFPDEDEDESSFSNEDEDERSFSEEDSYSSDEEEDGIALKTLDCTEDTRTCSQDYWNKLAHSNYESTVFENRVHVWTLPSEISQSVYGGRNKPSAACALITVQIAHNFMTQDIPIPSTSSQDSQNLSQKVMDALINGIVDGRETHDKAMAAAQEKESISMKNCQEGESTRFFKKPQRKGFTVLEAIQNQRPELHVVDSQRYSGHFVNNLVTAMTMVVTTRYLREVERLPIYVFAFRMAVCVIYDRTTHSIILLDSHSHGEKGSVVCVSSFEHITQFSSVVTKYVFDKTKDYNGEFGIACLMLTSLMNKVHQGKIFLPIGNKKNENSR